MVSTAVPRNDVPRADAVLETQLERLFSDVSVQAIVGPAPAEALVSPSPVTPRRAVPPWSRWFIVVVAIVALAGAVGLARARLLAQPVVAAPLRIAADTAHQPATATTDPSPTAPSRPTATPTPPTASPPPSMTPTSTATVAPSPTATPTPTETPVPTATPSPLATPAPPPDLSASHARLLIPAIGLDAPIQTVGLVMLQVNGERVQTWDVPRWRAVGWHSGSAPPGQPGNTVLNGHQNIYGGVFRRLDALQPGDEIIVRAGEMQFAYYVTERHVLVEEGQPLSVRVQNANWIMPTHDERLTLVTCAPDSQATHRLIVVALPLRATPAPAPDTD